MSNSLVRPQFYGPDGRLLNTASKEELDNLITLNGAKNASPSFWAPTQAGIEGQYLKSKGSEGSPEWEDAPTLYQYKIEFNHTQEQNIFPCYEQNSERFIRELRSQVKLITEKTQYQLSNSTHTLTDIYNFLTENNIIFNCYYIYTRYVAGTTSSGTPYYNQLESWFGPHDGAFGVFYTISDGIINYLNVQDLLKKSTYSPLLSVTNASKMTNSNTVVGVTTLETKMF